MFMTEGRDFTAFKIDLGIDKYLRKHYYQYQKNSHKNIPQKEQPHRIIGAYYVLGLF
jgi:hypothetical protein